MTWQAERSIIEQLVVEHGYHLHSCNIEKHDNYWNTKPSGYPPIIRGRTEYKGNIVIGLPESRENKIYETEKFINNLSNLFTHFALEKFLAINNPQFVYSKMSNKPFSVIYKEGTVELDFICSGWNVNRNVSNNVDLRTAIEISDFTEIQASEYDIEVEDE